MTWSDPKPHRTKNPFSVSPCGLDTSPPNGVADGRQAGDGKHPSATREAGGGGSGEARDGGGLYHRDPFPDRAPLDHVPVYPAPGRSWGEIILLGSIAVLGIAALAGCWPW